MDAHGWESTGIVPLVVWAVLCAGSNAVPVPATRNVYLSMSGPVNIAAAALFPPSATASLIFVSSVSQWELARQTTLVHAVFNRAQLALAGAAASAVMHRSDHLPPPAWLAAAAVVAYYGANWLLVASAERLARGTAMPDIIGRLLPSSTTAALYLAIGFVGVALAAVYDRVGGWAVALLLIPLLGARHAVRTAQDLEQSERARRHMATRLTMAQEHERVRIASDIHDVVLQRLAALQLQADTTAAAVGRADHDTAVRCAAAIRDGTDAVIADLRGAISNLRRNPLPPGGLGPALGNLAKSFEALWGVPVRIHHRPTGRDDLDPPVARLLCEICQEALTNVGRHAQARTVDIDVDVTPDAARLTVHDDGVGYRPGPSAGLGLELIRNKLALVGGSLSIDTTQGGTTLVATTPREC